MKKKKTFSCTVLYVSVSSWLNPWLDSLQADYFCVLFFFKFSDSSGKGSDVEKNLLHVTIDGILTSDLKTQTMVTISVVLSLNTPWERVNASWTIQLQNVPSCKMQWMALMWQLAMLARVVFDRRQRKEGKGMREWWGVGRCIATVNFWFFWFFSPLRGNAFVKISSLSCFSYSKRKI